MPRIDVADSPANQRRSESVCSSSSGPQEDKELLCSICMEVWTNDGEHQISCLPCGHLYGFSCITKWLQHLPSSGKCPQCNKTCSVNSVVKIYGSKLAAVDDVAQKRILFLEDKLKIYQEHHGQDEPSCIFRHQRDVLVNGGRIFDIDVDRKVLLLARRLSGSCGFFVLTQISLNTGNEILLPPRIGAIKDLRLSPHNNRLVVFGSRGKKLSVVSLDNHNTVLSYNHLPAAPWSCSWDRNSSHDVYTGLQNGMVLVFDMRQNRGPLLSLTGLTTNPVHSIHQLSANSTPTCDVRALLSASSMGLCQWTISGSEERASLVSESGNSGFCIASSYCPRTNHVVASYRKKVEFINDSELTQTDVDNSNGVEGFHVCLKRRGDDYQKLSSTQAFVDPICLLRTMFIDFGEERTQLFASCDKSTHELIVREPLTFAISQRFPLSSHLPIHDVKYAHLNGSGLLGLLTDDRLQLLRNDSP